MTSYAQVGTRYWYETLLRLSKSFETDEVDESPILMISVAVSADFQGDDTQRSVTLPE